MGHQRLQAVRSDVRPRLRLDRAGAPGDPERMQDTPPEPPAPPAPLAPPEPQAQPAPARGRRARGPIWPWLVAVGVGLLVGAGSAVAVSGGAIGAAGAGRLETGRWTTDLTVGGAAAGPWVRARVARVGLLALPRSETVYFDRTTDEAGQPLDPACTYAITGAPLQTRWWSITVYGSDQMLVRNDDRAHSIDATRAGGGAWQATLGPTRPVGGGLWLSTRDATAPILMVRLYNPKPSDDAALARLSLPRVERVACGADAEPPVPTATGGTP